jgi:hypothetical protein
VHLCASVSVSPFKLETNWRNLVMRAVKYIDVNTARVYMLCRVGIYPLFY